MMDIICTDDQILALVIVDAKMGSIVLTESKKVGVIGGTILLGKGTIRNPILNILGIDESRKEIVLMLISRNLEDKIHKTLEDKFHMNKPNHGIMLTMPVNKVFGCRGLTKKDSQIGGNKIMHEVIFTIVERGLGQEVVDAATKAGSTGATIINARGSGVHEHTKFFSMEIEPEKEVVMIIIEKNKVENIVEAIEKEMHIDDPGKGIIFTMDVNRVTGLFKDKN